MSNTKLPGIKAKHFIVSDECCEARQENGALEFVLSGIADEFHKLRETWKGKGAKIHIAMTIEYDREAKDEPN